MGRAKGGEERRQERRCNGGRVGRKRKEVHGVYEKEQGRERVGGRGRKGRLGELKVEGKSGEGGKMKGRGEREKKEGTEKGKKKK